MSGDDIRAGVPPKIIAGVEAYVSHRAPPGMFLRALLGNQLDDCCAYLPPGMTLAEVRASVRLIFNLTPGRARGSYQAVDSWLSGSTPAPEAPEVAQRGA